GADRFFEPATLGFQIVSREHGMIEMINNRVAINELALPAQVVNARSQIGIRTDASAKKALIKLIDGQDVSAPESHVAPDDATLLFVSQNDRLRQPDRLGCSRHAARQQPAPDWRHSDFELRDELFLNVAAAALHPESRLRQPFM